jgi:hypothetical protein
VLKNKYVGCEEIKRVLSFRIAEQLNYKKAHDQFLDRELGESEELRIAKACRQLLPTAALLPCPLLSVSLRTKLFALQTNCHVRPEIHP